MYIHLCTYICIYIYTAYIQIHVRAPCPHHLIRIQFLNEPLLEESFMLFQARVSFLQTKNPAQVCQVQVIRVYLCVRE